MAYCELHAHSEYSLLDGLNSIPLYVSTAKKMGFTKLALTDHGNVCGAYLFYKECKKQGLKPIIGAEIYISDSKQEKIHQRHLVLLVKNNAGWKNLCNLITIANLQGRLEQTIFSRPKLTYADFEDKTEGLIALTACSSGVLNYWFNQEEMSKSYAYEKAEDELLILKSLFQKDLYIEIMPYSFGYDYQSKLIELGTKHQVEFVVTGDIHYASFEDTEVHDALIASQYKKKITDKVGFTDKLFYLKTERGIRALFRKSHSYISDALLNQMISNTELIADNCNFEFEIQSDELPTPYPKEDSQKKIIELCRQGWKLRKIDDPDGRYDARLDEELELIFEKNFENYFLILYDILFFCREKGIITGPGRGSSAGSLVAYLLQITHVDPIEYGLLFFRFIDPSRNDLPDIDTDFQEDRRQEVFAYIIEKYGEEKVAHINTFSRLSSKVALADMARVFNIPSSETLKVTKQLDSNLRLSEQIENPGLQKFIEKNLKPFQFATRIEGNIRQRGVHAAGIVLSRKRLQDNFPLDSTKFSLPAVSLDGWGELGLLKIDILGLNYLLIFQKTLEAINNEIDIYSIQPNDEKVLKSIFENQTAIFQLDTSLMKKLIKDLGSSGDFKLITDLNALARPGALHSGATARYIQKQIDKTIESEYYFSELEQYLSETNGEILYQEQVMLICKDIADFTWAEVNKVRKIIGKTLGKEELNKWKQKFLDQGVKNKFDLEKLILLWNDIETFGGYGFNKSHAVVYSLIGYWCGFFRYYYPKEYFSSFIAYSGKEIIASRCIQEMKKLGFKFLLPDINFSKEQMVYDGYNVYCGFEFVKGLGGRTIEEIIDKQPYSSIEDFSLRINKRVVNKNIQDILVKIGAFRSFFGEDELDTSAQFLFEKKKKKDIETAEEEIDISDLIPILEGYEKINRLTEKILTTSKIQFSFIGDILDFEDGENIYLVSFLQELNVKKSEWGDYGKLLILDEFGTLEIHVPVSKLTKYFSTLMKGKRQVILLKILKGENGETFSLDEVLLSSEYFDDNFSSSLKKEIITGDIFDATKYVRNIKINLYKYFTFKITHIKEHHTKTKQELMAFIKLEDEDGREIECLAWPDFYKKQKTALIEGDWYQFQFDDAKDGKVFCGRNTKIKKGGITI